MPDYTVNCPELRYSGQTYRQGEVVNIRTSDVRLLLAIGKIREKTRDNRVASFKEKAEPVPQTVKEHMEAHYPTKPEPIVAETEPVVAEKETPTVVSNDTEDTEFKIEDTEVPPELEAEMEEEHQAQDDVMNPEDYKPRRRRYSNRQMKSED